MKNMEQEPKFEKSREEKLREKGYQIESTQLPAGEPTQCDKCMDKDNNFQFHQEGWFVEGQFYCPKHREVALDTLEEIDKDVERRKLEQEQIIGERRKNSV